MGNILNELGRAITAIFKLIFGRGRKKFNSINMLAKWQEIEDILKSGDSLHAAQAVIQADIYFDKVMKTLGAKGETYADRLRSIKKHLTNDTYEQIWRAHKFRNKIAHEHIIVTAHEAKAALKSLRRGASQLGAF